MKVWRAKVYRQARKTTNWKGSRWLKLRAKILKRDKYRCQMCKDFWGEGDFVLTPYHIKSRKKGGTNDPKNLITLCNKCHDIAEMEGLTKKQILDYKFNEQQMDIFRPIAYKPDWHLWVYGGHKRPELNYKR